MKKITNYSIDFPGALCYSNAIKPMTEGSNHAGSLQRAAGSVSAAAEVWRMGS